MKNILLKKTVSCPTKSTTFDKSHFSIRRSASCPNLNRLSQVTTQLKPLKPHNVLVNGHDQSRNSEKESILSVDEGLLERVKMVFESNGLVFDEKTKSASRLFCIEGKGSMRVRDAFLPLGLASLCVSYAEESVSNDMVLTCKILSKEAVKLADNDHFFLYEPLLKKYILLKEAQKLLEKMKSLQI
jgi:hypothetical protein